MKKQRFLSMAAAFICLFSVFSASAARPVASGAVPAEKSGGAVVYAEKTRWYYRTTNGVKEKRLWSITYGRWLTDWMPMVP